MQKPIGIFDSGIGGLTVVKQLMHLLPGERLIYFGDTARIPYGNKSKRLIEQYAMEDARFLLQYDVKALVVACNTASSLAMDVLLKNLDIPVIGVVNPGAAAAARLTRNNRIGVIGTIATISSDAYRHEIDRLRPEAQVVGQPCPLLVPLVEEGWLDDEITRLTLKRYLHPLIEQQVDTLILGCTHYPLLEQAIAETVGANIQLIDSGKEAARAVKEVLHTLNIENREVNNNPNHFFVSDIPARFEEVGSRFLGQKLTHVERVNFDQFLLALGSASFSDRVMKEEV
jgi:glutamate racemase